MFATLVLILAQAAAPPAATPAPAAAPPPAPSRPTDWPFRALTGDDYPARALREEAQGRVAYRLEIGADGRVANCTVRESSGYASLDTATCAIIRRRARFTPARDSEGNAIPDSREGELFWQLPQE